MTLEDMIKEANEIINAQCKGINCLKVKCPYRKLCVVLNRPVNTFFGAQRP